MYFPFYCFLEAIKRLPSFPYIYTHMNIHTFNNTYIYTFINTCTASFSTSSLPPSILSLFSDRSFSHCKRMSEESRDTLNPSLTPADLDFFSMALAEAKEGAAEGGIPIGAVLTVDGRIVGRGHNQRVQRGSAVLHGEMAALENAGRLPASAYANATMYTTLSPCAMCTGAILLYRIRRVVIGENTTFMGEEELLRNRGVKVVVVNSAECVDLMKTFIRDQPYLWNEDIGEESERKGDGEEEVGRR